VHKATHKAAATVNTSSVVLMELVAVVLVHKDRSVSQWMIIKMKHNMCVKHIVVAVCHAIEVTL
jgi:hypothetical protein